MANPRFAKPVWHLVDAKNMVVGRLATQISHVLRGKHKPTYTPNYNCGDYVGTMFIHSFTSAFINYSLPVVINARHANFSGNKEKDKVYTWHTGYPGGVKTVNPARLREDKPEEVMHVKRALHLFFI